jgi:hypothetical protein
MKISLFASLSAVLLPVFGQVVDLNFYPDEACEEYGAGCSDLAENTCCAVSEGGTTGYSSATFLLDDGEGEVVNWNLYSYQNGDDCGVPNGIGTQQDFCIFTENLLSYQGGAYSFVSSKRKRSEDEVWTTVAADRLFYKTDETTYYINTTSEDKAKAFWSVAKVGGSAALLQFVANNYDYSIPTASRKAVKRADQ